MAYNFGNQYFGNSSQAPMFPQPNGNVYLIQNSLEVANVPAGAGITIALCMAENLMYLKTIQNGQPTFLAFRISPYTDAPRQTTPPQTSNEVTLENRVAVLEKQLSTLMGGNKNVQQSSANDASISTKSANTDANKWDV